MVQIILATIYCQNSGSIRYGLGPQVESIKDFTIDNNGWTNQNLYPRLVGDYDGDGFDDIIAFGNNTVTVAYGDTTNLFTVTETISTEFGVTSTGFAYTSFDVFPRFIADVNNDTMADIIGCENDGIYVSLSQGRGNQVGPKTRFSTKFGVDDNYTTYDIYPRAMYDVDGDGFDDIIGFSENGVEVRYSDGTSFVQRAGSDLANQFSTPQNFDNQDRHPRYIADYNGDGFGDIIAISENTIQLSLSINGVGFGPIDTNITEFYTPAITWSSINGNPRFWRDFNNDGRADIVGCSSADISGIVSKQDGSLSMHHRIQLPDYSVSDGYNNQDSEPRLIGNFNGDQFLDVVGFKSDSVYYSLGFLQCSDPTRDLANNCACRTDINVYENNDDDVCPTCVYPCLTCTNSTNCLSCQDLVNRNDDNQCSCFDGFFDDTTSCVQCDHRFCGTCDTSSDNCIQQCDSSCAQCNIDGTCSTCAPGWYLSSGQCLQCHPKCLTCQDQFDTCILCSLTGLGRIQENNCGCEDGYYESNLIQNNCVKCLNDKCRICGENDTCIQCISEFAQLPLCELDNSNIPQAQNNNVIALIGPNGQQYYAQCDVKCDQCIGSVDNCISCINGRNRNQIQPCECIQGYHDNNGITKDCYKCSSNCLNCLNQNTCMKCIEGLNRKLNLENGYCECIQGYKENNINGICEKCNLFQGKCYNECPTNTILNKENNMCEQITENQIQQNMTIIIIFGALILLSVSLFYMALRKTVTRKFININSENIGKQQKTQQQK